MQKSEKQSGVEQELAESAEKIFRGKTLRFHRCLRFRSGFRWLLTAKQKGY